VYRRCISRGSVPQGDDTEGGCKVIHYIAFGLNFALMVFSVAMTIKWAQIPDSMKDLTFSLFAGYGAAFCLYNAIRIIREVVK
jgi:uncharacterized membrane protein